MNEQAFRRLVSGQQSGFVRALLRAGLYCLSLPYAGAVRLRNAAFDHGWKAVLRLPVPVISIGNLTTGGTGKTPVVAMVVQMLQQQGMRPGIVSRGFRADHTGVNDEKRVLDQLCPGVPHQQQSDRVAAGLRLLAQDHVDVIVMDDGLQHRRLHRDLDIVLVDATCPFGFGHLLPRGLLREPLWSLKRAQLVLITRSDLVTAGELQKIESEIVRVAPSLRDRLHRLRFQPSRLLGLQGMVRQLDEVAGCRTFLMSGIGNAEAFLATCQQAGLDVVGQKVFTDHHHYSRSDLDAVVEESGRLGAELLITTQKDLVKLTEEQIPVWALQITAQFDQDMSYHRVAELIASVTQISA